jgi:excinuclease ABC subunit C
VFINGNPVPAQYRRFKIKTLEGSNDFAALQEVIERRWQRGLAERAENKQPLDFGNFPDLVVIDGGKGQLSAVCERLAELGAAKVDIISLAKREEEVFLPKQSEPLLLAKDSAGLQLLQRLRDEAHRFALAYHRKLRGKGQVKSELESIPGIGEKRRKALLKSFGSLKNVKQASLEELIAAPGMTKAAAKAVYRYLHQAEPVGRNEEG